MQDANYWISHLALNAHPEGGFYKEIYRSNQFVSRVVDLKMKNSCTSIYYLLSGNDYSGFHRLASDEIWYFHKGDPLAIYIFNGEGNLEIRELSDRNSGHLSVVVEAGQWFAASLPGKSGFTLVSCVVAPGFDFAEFEMAQKEYLIQLFPLHSEIIERFSR